MDYKNLLLLALGLTMAASDQEIIERYAKVYAMTQNEAGALKAFSAQFKRGGDSTIDAEVARQMGNSAAAVKKYGTMCRA